MQDAEDHSQLEGVRVELRSFTGTMVAATITRGAGDFAFPNISSGSYEVVVSQSGYHTVTKRVEVNESVLGFSVDLHRNSSLSTATPGPSSVSTRELSIPRKAHEALDKGLALMQKKPDYLKSIKQFERAVKEYPEYYEAFTLIGIAYLHMGNSSSAEQALRKAVKLSQEHDIDALSWLATSLNDSHRFADAQPIARKGVELDSSSWQANAELARSLLGLNHPVEAEKSAQAASKLQPDNSLLYLVLANIHSQMDNVAALLEDLNNYLRLAPIGPMAEQARAEKKQLQERLAEAQRISVSYTSASIVSDPAIKDGTAGTPDAAISNLEDSPTLNFGAQEESGLWAHANVDDALPPVTPGVSCHLDEVLKGARKRVQELLENVDRFSATEDIDFAEIGRDGRASRSLKYTFDYLAEVSLSHDGDLRFDESRKEIGKINSTPIPIRTVGLAVGAAVFHPLRLDDYETTCEGLGIWHDRPAWQLRFEQRPDKVPRFQAVLVDGNWFDVKLKGRVWISPETSQIEHIDFDLLEAVSRIRLQTEHMSIDYSAVDFPKRNLQLWLPQDVNFYIDIGGHRFLNHHQLSNYILFAVDTSQEIKSPRVPN